MYSTIDDLIAAPQSDDLKYELWQGELRWSKRPSGYYEQVKNRIYTLLNDSMTDPSGGQLHNGTVGYQLQRNPDTVLFPDISVVRSASRLTLEKQINIFAEIPSIVVEIPGPSDRFGKIAMRVAKWRAAGTRVVIVVDCESKSLQCFRDGQEGSFSRESEPIAIGDQCNGLQFSAIDVFRSW